MPGDAPGRYHGLGKQIFLAELGAAGIVIFILFVWDIRGLALEMLIAVVAAVVIEPVVRLMVRVRLPRPLAVGIAIIVLLAAATLLLLTFSIPVYDAGVKLLDRLPQLEAAIHSRKGQLAVIIAKLNLQHYVNISAQEISSLAQRAILPAVSAATGLLGFLTNVAITGTLILFFSLEGPRVISALAAVMPPEREERMRAVLHETSLAITGYLVGNLLTSIIAGIVVYLVFSILGLPFALLVAVWVGLVDLIPLIGGLLAGIPAVGLALFAGLPQALVVLAVFLVYQQVENHLLNPLILSRTVRLNPLWVLLAVLIGAQIAQLPGALIAIPVASALQVLFRSLLREPVVKWLNHPRWQRND